MKPLKCSVCMKTFKKERDAEKHIRDAHDGVASIMPTGERQYGSLGKSNGEKVEEGEQQGICNG